MFKRTNSIAHIVRVCFALTAVVAGTSAYAAQKIPITVAMPVTIFHPSQSYYTSVPLKLFWEQEGLDVRVLKLPGANTAAAAVDAGKADVAFASNSALFALLEAHPETDFMAYYTFITHFIAIPEVLPDSPIKTIADLEGKTVGLQSLGNSQMQTTRALVKLAGGDPDSLKFVAVGEGAAAARALKTGRVDALSLYDALYAIIEANGTELRPLRSAQLAPDSIGFQSSMFVSRSYFKDHKEALTRLARGVAKATIFAKTNPEATVRIHWQVYPASKPRGVSEEEAMRRSLAPLKRRMSNVSKVNGLIGGATREQVKGYMQVLVEGGVLKEPIPVDVVWDPSLLEAINKFDKDAIQQMAERWGQ